MPICNVCKNKWGWAQTIKKMMTLNAELTCPYCEAKQYQSKRSKVRGSLLNLLIIMPLLINSFFDVSAIVILSLIPVLVIFGFIVYPFLVELSNEEQFPFTD